MSKLRWLPDSRTIKGGCSSYILVIIVLAVILLSSCYNQRKAQQQVTRAVIEYPIVATNILRYQFPCVTTTDTLIEYISDSADYQSVIDLLQFELQNTYVLHDSLMKALQSGDTACKKYEAVISVLQKQNRSLTERLKKIPAIHDTVRITLPPEKDMAEVRACEIIRDQAVQLAAEKTADVTKFKKRARNWMLVSLGLLLAIGVWGYFKTKTLFTKK